MGLKCREDGMLPWAGLGLKCREDRAMPVGMSPGPPVLQICWCVPVLLLAPRIRAIPAVAAELMISDSSRWGQVWEQSLAE